MTIHIFEEFQLCNVICIHIFLVAELLSQFEFWINLLHKNIDRSVRAVQGSACAVPTVRAIRVVQGSVRVVRAKAVDVVKAVDVTEAVDIVEPLKKNTKNQIMEKLVLKTVSYENAHFKATFTS